MLLIERNKNKSISAMTENACLTKSGEITIEKKYLRIIEDSPVMPGLSTFRILF